MARNKAHEVTMPKSDKDKMTIRIPAEEIAKMDRAARRNADIERGTFIRGGVHGGDKRQRNRRERRDARVQARRGYEE